MKKQSHKTSGKRNISGRKAAVGHNRKASNVGKGTLMRTLEGDVTGRLEGNPAGFAFLIRDDGGKDLFVSASSMGDAIHGDKVRAQIRIGRRKDGEEAVIVGIIEPATNVVIGTYIKGLGGKGAVVADDRRINKDISISDADCTKVSSGSRVLAKITGRKNGLSGKITRVFDPSEKIDWDILSVIVAHNLIEEFSSAARKEAENQPDEISENELKDRVDFRDSAVITIDGDDSRDFDDAVSVMKKEGRYELCVHIADVSHYVKTGSAIDKDAFRRGTSVYFPGSFIPMLPEKLSNNICSLMEGKDRLTLSVIMEIDSKGRVKKHKIVNGVIRSAHRMTYSAVAKIFDGDQHLSKQYSDIIPMLLLMKELAHLLMKKRQERGSVDFDLPEPQIIVGADGGVLDVVRAPRHISNRIIEEFMLVTNETVAEHMLKVAAPFVYRAHTPPTPQKLMSFEDFLAAMSVPWHREEPVRPADYKALLDGLEDGVARVINMMALRSMTKAVYYHENKGHFGLAAEYYCHFTSPIRRYPDLMIHRIIKDYLLNGKKNFGRYSDAVVEAGQQSSFTERQADDAERAVDDIYKARYMKNKIGESYTATISGVTEWGIYAELENTVEGMIRKDNLPGSDYFYNPVLMSLSNMSNIYRLGDSIKITVSGVTKDKVEFIPTISDDGR